MQATSLAIEQNANFTLVVYEKNKAEMPVFPTNTGSSVLVRVLRAEPSARLHPRETCSGHKTIPAVELRCTSTGENA